MSRRINTGGLPLPGRIKKTWELPGYAERKKAKAEKDKAAEQKIEDKRLAIVTERNKIAKKIRGEK
jgi:hypothetical protein